ncbi:tetratricopeptide repeat protein [Rhizobium sp. CFBP 13726]|uniref:tetratricopeptide repeat protein n=1 Tax=Rhizobium/Agrobacterium group TaxID=227290 RepID=UPI001783DFCB|nr:tetratricopeptide repeat protein [Rhizobium sp. CFBP 13726]MBD8650983.1 tetratricopeptide repeat protein [Rhizobium sp. CFBP 13726]
MAQNDDSFFREVNEELRSDQLQYVWKRYSRILIGIAVLVVVGTAAWRGYEYWENHGSSQSGDRFIAALDLASKGKNDEALAALSAIEKDGSGAYPVLAKMRAGSVQAAKGDTGAAISTFTAIGGDTSAPAAIRDLAKLRAAWLLIDAGTYDQVSAQAQAMANQGQTLANSAREALGLAAYKAGNMAEAKTWFQRIAEDASAPRNVANRAQIMLDNIAASGKAP